MRNRRTSRLGLLAVAALIAPTLLVVALAPPASAATSYAWGADLSEWWSIDNAKRGEAIGAAKASGMTLFFTDAKDGWGLAGWGTPSYKQVTSFATGDGGVDRVVRDAHAAGIKVAARFDIFNDAEAAKRFPGAVIGGNPAWVDPACADVRAYLTGMAKDLVSRTKIDEFHFDHIRYPQPGEDGASGSARLPCTGGTLGNPGSGKNRVDVISSFIQETTNAVKGVRPVMVSMSIFGRAMESPMYDIGQDAGRLAPILDRLMPMFYPSYFSADAEAHPGEYMTRVTTAAVKRFGGAEIVPWVQGFDAYAGKTAPVCTQIKAATASGASGALVWWFPSMGTSQATWKTLAACLPASGSAPAPSPSPTPSTAPTFTGVQARNWWQQVTVSGSPVRVDVRINDGPWIQMAKQSWGGYGVSKPLNAGDKVQFQAGTPDGKWHWSPAYKANGDGSVSAWTGSTPAPAPSTAPTFTGIMAKNWWQQVTVSGSPVRVDVRINDGAWIQMAKQSWGGYGVSKPLNGGDKVQFQAGMPDGKWHWSPAYRANGDGSVTYLYG